MKRLFAILLAVCLLSSALAGCGKAPAETQPTTLAPTEPTTVPTEPPTEPLTEPTEPLTEPTEPPMTDPLTGETVNVDMTGWRPYTVMINNIVYAQPQCGITGAAIVYEVLVESGITRMMAVYSDISKADTLGSIRSLRPCYVSICRAYDSILIHAGGSKMAYSDVRSNDIDRMDGVQGGVDATYFYRDPSRQSHGIEHSLFIHAEDILECIERLEYRTQLREDYPGFGLQFSEDATPQDGQPAGYIDINFRDGKHSYLTYDGYGYYTMDQYGDDYIDGNNGDQAAFRNILILYADTWNGHDYNDPSNPRVYMELTGEGTGHFACGGKYIEIYWTRADEDSPFLYFLDEAHTQPLTLGVGATYVAIVPTSSSKPEFSLSGED